MAQLLRTLKAGVLASVRLQLGPAVQQGAAGPASLQLLRSFADASYLDKGAVTDRVLSVVKNFEKVDAGKVSAGGLQPARLPTFRVLAVEGLAGRREAPQAPGFRFSWRQRRRRWRRQSAPWGRSTHGAGLDALFPLVLLLFLNLVPSLSTPHCRRWAPQRRSRRTLAWTAWTLWSW